jgi:hypothetical protein
MHEAHARNQSVLPQVQRSLMPRKFTLKMHILSQSRNELPEKSDYINSIRTDAITLPCFAPLRAIRLGARLQTVTL